MIEVLGEEFEIPGLEIVGKVSVRPDRTGRPPDEAIKFAGFVGDKLGLWALLFCVVRSNELVLGGVGGEGAG